MISKEDEVIRILSPRKFHRLFTLPATENHGALKVSYSIAGPEDGDIPTILFVGGMFCTRWYIIGYEYIAQKEGVRILSIDRLVLRSLISSPDHKAASIYHFRPSRDLPRLTLSSTSTHPLS